MATFYYTKSQLKALDILTKSGIIAQDTSPGKIERATEIILNLADKIRNERDSLTLQLSERLQGNPCMVAENEA